MNYRDGRTRFVHVGIHRGAGFVPAGVIEFNGTTEEAGFRYLSSYRGPPLDPVNLDYRGRVDRYFPVNGATNKDLLHRVFIDYLPGPWGLQVLQAERPELKTMRAAEKLHWFGSRTVGSLSFFVAVPRDEEPVHGIDRLEEIRRRSVALFIGKSQRIGMDQWVLDGLTAFGGARPKCIFTDHAGGQWLAKFNVDTDPYNYARVEHAVAVLAKRCGVRAVDTMAFDLGGGEDVLFVRRFDRGADGRPHRISAFSMMREDIVKAQNEGDYSMLFELVRKICCDPQAEVEELARRMLFNIAVNNTDDHLKNFELLLDGERHCYRLSPSFDMTVDPYPNARITAAFGLKRPSLSDATLQIMATGSGLELGMLLQMRDHIVEEVSRWPELFAAAGVDRSQISKLQRSFDYGLSLSDDHGIGRKPSP